MQTFKGGGRGMCKGPANRLCKLEVQKEAGVAGGAEAAGWGWGWAGELRLRGGQAQT